MAGQELQSRQEDEPAAERRVAAVDEARARSDSQGRVQALQTMARRYFLWRQLRFLTGLAPAFVAGIVAFYLAIHLTAPALGHDGAGLLGFVFYLGVMLPTLFLGLRAASRRRSEDLRRLARGLGAEAVGPLIDLLRADVHPGRSRWSPLLGTLVDLLTERLPGLRASDAPLLDDRQRGALNDILARCERYYTWPGVGLLARRRARLFRPAFVEAILAALTQVGDARAVPYVERLAGLAGRQGAAGAIGLAAADCLPALRNAAEHTAQARTLLRPAGAERDDATLVRPAAGAGAGNAADLVRPSGPPPR